MGKIHTRGLPPLELPGQDTVIPYEEAKALATKLAERGYEASFFAEAGGWVRMEVGGLRWWIRRDIEGEHPTPSPARPSPDQPESATPEPTEEPHHGED